ncbi:MAG: hypothetical protein ACFE9S_04305 [Candidatus Hermodarchaeota archaeon]
MSSQSVEKTEIIILSFDNYQEDSIDFKKILIPFSKFGISKTLEYIYEGFEKIIFKERHPCYKSILLDEFAE